jgi:hypothetical protein
MLHDFLHEIFHENHFDSVYAFDEKAVDVVVLLPDESTLAQLRNILAHKSSMLFRQRVHILKGEPFNSRDLERVQLRDAMQAFVLPNLVAPDPGADDGANIMRTFAIGRHTPYVHTLCMLHRAENNPSTLTLKGSNLSFLSVDAFKLSMLAKACLTKGALSFILNLCKTTGDDLSYNLKAWQRDYGHSVGMELYEVLLSTSYDQEKFGDVTLDILHRSQVGEVIMIGVVEDPVDEFDNANQRKVRIHPGADYVLTADGCTSGIFIAPDVGTIRQKGDSSDRAASALAGPRAAASQVDTPRQHGRPKGGGGRASVFQMTTGATEEASSDKKRMSFAAEVEMNRKQHAAEIENRAQEEADARYTAAMTEIKRRLLVQGIDVPLVDAVSSAFKDVKEAAKVEVAEEIYCSTSKYEEEPEDPKDVIKLSKNSMLYNDDEAGLEELQQKNKVMDKMEQMALRSNPLPAHIHNHLLLCIVSDTTDNVDHLKPRRTVLDLQSVSSTSYAHYGIPASRELLSIPQLWYLLSPCRVIGTPWSTWSGFTLSEARRLDSKI